MSSSLRDNNSAKLTVPDYKVSVDKKCSDDLTMLLPITIIQ